MDVTWYLVLSALLFAIGACGVLIRRSPLVILLCLELMLNAGNLALVAFSRSTGNEQGQVFALVVMVVAACEVVVGLGLIVAMFRRRVPLNVDDIRELRGLMDATTYGWLVLAFPLAGSLVIALGFRVLPARTAGWIGTARDRARLRRLDRDAARAARSSHGRPGADRLALQLRVGGRARHPARDPRRPAVGVHVPGRHRGLDADPPLLGRLHGAPTSATGGSSRTSTSSSSRCCCWSSPATSCS